MQYAVYSFSVVAVLLLVVSRVRCEDFKMQELIAKICFLYVYFISRKNLSRKDEFTLNYGYDVYLKIF